MVKKITVSVSDELHEKMMKYRERFKFSHVFQEAMSKKVESIETFLLERKEGIDMNLVIERLKNEKKESEEKWFEVGKKDGFDWAAEAHYEDLMEALDIKYDQHDWPRNEIIKEYLDLLQSEFDGEYDALFDDNNLTMLGHEYLNGFEEGVQEFWDQVKDKI